MMAGEQTHRSASRTTMMAGEQTPMMAGEQTHMMAGEQTHMTTRFEVNRIICVNTGATAGKLEVRTSGDVGAQQRSDDRKAGTHLADQEYPLASTYSRQSLVISSGQFQGTNPTNRNRTRRKFQPTVFEKLVTQIMTQLHWERNIPGAIPLKISIHKLLWNLLPTRRRWQVRTAVPRSEPVATRKIVAAPIAVASLSVSAAFQAHRHLGASRSSGAWLSKFQDSQSNDFRGERTTR